MKKSPIFLLWVGAAIGISEVYGPACAAGIRQGGLFPLSREFDSTHAEGEVSPRGRAKVPAYPLCGGFTPATPPIQSLFFELSASHFVPNMNGESLRRWL
jgi:hypothetical protein